VTELTQPLAAAPAEPTRRVSEAVAPRQPVTFAELVHARFAWWHAYRNNALDPSIVEAYQHVREGFEGRHGEIVRAYWSSHVESGVVLTQKKRVIPWARPIPSLHRETDLVMQHWPDLARELHRCDEIAVRARTVLSGVRRVIAMHLVMASAAHLLSLADARATQREEPTTADAIGQEHDALDRAEAYYCDAANGQAQVVYFAGMAAIAAVLGICSAVSLAIDWEAPVAALMAGALGAVVSVVQRINAGKFNLDYDVGRPYALFLGGLRPLIGGAFAIVISFAFLGGLLHLPLAASEPNDHRRLALLVLSFVAGFSERWAQDTLAAAVPAAGTEKAGT